MDTDVYPSFITRLKSCLIKQGFRSRTSKMGVQVAPLAKHLRVSVQTIRKYINGDSSPDLNTIVKISSFLEVSPSFLAFGEDTPNIGATRNFEIKKVFIKEIFDGVFCGILNLRLHKGLKESIHTFLHGIINDIAQLESDDELKLRLIKTSISSARIVEKKKWKQPISPT